MVSGAEDECLSRQGRVDVFGLRGTDCLIEWLGDDRR